MGGEKLKKALMDLEIAIIDVKEHLHYDNEDELEIGTTIETMHNNLVYIMEMFADMRSNVDEYC